MAGTKKYKTDMLKNIIKLYFSQNTVIGQVSATDLAHFANKIPGYENIRYNTFTRDKEVKAMLDKANSYIYTGEDRGSLTMVNINPDAIMDTHDEATIKMIFRSVADRYNELNQVVVDFRTTVDANNVKIKELEAEIKKLKEKNKELKFTNDILSKTNKHLSRFKIFEEQVAMREFLNARGLFSKLNETNLSILLSKSGFREDANLGAKSPAIKGSLSTCEIGANNKDYIKNDAINEKVGTSGNLINLKDKKTEINKDASDVIKELKDIFTKK